MFLHIYSTKPDAAGGVLLDMGKSTKQGSKFKHE